jgi:hypothetical protein
LEAHLAQSGVIERYIAGELGLNLLFTYKSLAMTRHIAELQQLAREAAVDLMREGGLDSPEVLEFVNDAIQYDACRMTNLFAHSDEDVRSNFRYDVEGFMRKREPGPVTDYKLSDPLRMRFVLDADQRATINRGLVLFGSDEAGVGRILSKFHITRLLRRPAREIETDGQRASKGIGHPAPTPINLLDA